MRIRKIVLRVINIWLTTQREAKELGETRRTRDCSKEMWWQNTEVQSVRKEFQEMAKGEKVERYVKDINHKT